MRKKLPFLRNLGLLNLAFTFLFLCSTQVINAQCAGDDNAITICDIPNPANQTIALFALLGGTPMSSGTWNDDLNSGGLNAVTGILNVHQIRNSGIYTYTYTVTGIPGCVDTTATITVVVGGYAGVPGPNGAVCGDETDYNLFQLFSGTGGNLGPQFNGNWFNVTTGAPISGSSINPSSFNVITATTYQFSYTLPAIGSCAVNSVSAFLTVYPPAEPGTPMNLEFCSTQDLSPYANLNLYSLLTGEDGGGRWIDNSGTGELTTPTDSFINVPNIYANFGAGIYSFTYDVFPSNPICNRESSTVTITIEDPINYSNISLQVNSDICETQIASATYIAVLTQSPVTVPNGTYNVTYTVSGQIAPVTVTASFVGGILSFPIPNSNFQSVGSYTITVTNIVATASLGICVNTIPLIQDVLTIYPSPAIPNAVLTVDNVCQNTSSNAVLSNISNLPDGSYTITYALSGVNVSVPQTQVINVLGGVSNFALSGSLLANSGTTILTITNITNNTTTCTAEVTISDSFEVLPLPSVPALSMTVGDVCFGQTVNVTLSGLGTLTNVSINYDLSDANVSTGNSQTMTVTSGSATFTIPSGLLVNTGSTTVSVTNLTNTGNTCGIVVSNVSDSFIINALPIAPSAADQTFCETDNATVADLIPNSSQYKWYSSSSGGTVLAPSTILVSGNYYVSETNPATGCESVRTQIAVTVEVVPAPVLASDGDQFCGIDNPTIQSLSDNVTVTGNLIWYDAPTGGNLLASTALLTEGTTYYGYDSSATGCLSKNVLAVTVTLTDCDEEPIDFFIPDGFSPNGDGVNDSYTIPDIEFVYPDYKLEIYNRYGNLMFEGNRNKPRWDGKNSESKIIGDVAPNGVYFYVVYFNKNNKAPLQGRLYLNR